MMKKCISVFLAFSLIVSTGITSSVFSVKAEQAATGTVIDVTKYGADPSGAEDSAEAVQKAIEAAKKADGPVTISFPKGEYHFYPEKSYERELYISNTVGDNQTYKMKKIGILLEKMNDVTVEGNDSLFMFHGKMTSFAAIDCKNVVFQNYAMDYQVPTVIDVTIESVEGKSATVFVPECYDYQINGTNVTWKSDVSPYTGQAYWSTNNAMNYTQIFDIKAGTTVRAANHLFSNVTSIEDKGNHRLKFHYSSLGANVKPGYCYQMRPTVRDHAGMFFWKNQGVVLKNLDVHFLHGFGIVGQSSTDVTLDGINFDTPKGSGRTTVGYADFIQMSGCKGQVNVENCVFANPHDDPINIHGTFMQVVQRIANNKFKVTYKHGETAGFPNFFVGDEVEFMTSSNMIPVANSVAKVTAVEGPSGDRSQSPTGNLRDIIITLDKDMPSNIVANQYVVENITYTPSVMIRNNYFKETPTRGVLVTTRKKIEIRDNIFDAMGMAAIYISNDAQGWYESGPTRDVTIENNIFRRSGVGTQTQAVILVAPTNPAVSTDKTVHENMKINGNTFYMADNNVLSAKSVKDLSFTNNKIYRYDPNVSITLSADKTSLKKGEKAKLSANASGRNMNSNLYSFNGCRNVNLSGNTYDGGLKKNASISNMAASEIKQGTGEDVRIGGAANQPSATGTVSYESSDTKVVTVANDGTVTAAGAGKANVRAFSVIAGRKFISDQITITVDSGNGSEASTVYPGTDKASGSGLASATLEGVSGMAAFDSKVYTYLATAMPQQKTAKLSLKTKDANAKVKLFVNAKEVTEKAAGLDNVEVSLTSGINVIMATVIAEDGKTQSEYRFSVIRTGYNISTLSGIQIDGKSLEGFTANKYQYDVTTQKGAEKIKVEAVGAAEQAQITMMANGKVLSGASGELSLKPGRNDVTIQIRPETMAQASRYELIVIVPSDDNARLQSAVLGEGAILNEEFSAEQFSYTGIVVTKNLKAEFKAEEKNAEVAVTMSGKEMAKGNGQVSVDLPMFKEGNWFTVTVASPGKTFGRVYTYSLTGKNESPLSVLNETSDSYSGYGSTVAFKNTSQDGNKLTLRKEDGTTAAFESGVGSHATCSLEYHIEGMGFEKFSTYMGVDQEIKNKEEADMIFRIYVDGVKKYESGKMTGTSPMVFQEVSVAGAKKLRLEADKITNDYSDHADFADAKFTTDMPARTQNNNYTVKYQGEGGSVTAVSESGNNESGLLQAAEGSKVTLQAKEMAGKVFDGWYIGNVRVSESKEYTIDAVTKSETYLAKFKDPSAGENNNPNPGIPNPGIPNPGTGAQKLASSVISSVKSSFKGITVKWSSVKGAASYEVRRNGKVIANTAKTFFLDNTAKSGAVNTYEIIAKGDGSQYKDSDVSVKKSPKLPKSTSALKAVRKAGGVSLKWKKVKGATGYVVLRASSLKGTYKKVKIVKTNSYVDKKAKGKKAYYKVVVKKKTLYSMASKVKKVTLK